ncbi:MAG TPA: glycosyltransferase [Gaiellaceae bacterium]|nr:glycosyltransferase [Gaiellaceae bacterium]
MAEARAVAVVVPVLDEAESLPALLADLAAQEPAPAEIVVVDAGSTDGTLDLLRAEALRLPALRVVESPGATPGRGRNEGVRASAAALVVTLDAGSRVGPGFVRALAATVAAGPRAVAVGVAEPDARSAFERAAGWFTLRAFKPPDAPGPIGAEFLPAGRNGLAFAREAWEEAGGYPPDLPWGEDKLFLRALRAAGYELTAVPEAVVRWRPRGSPRALWRQYRNYGRGDALGRVDRQNELVTLGLLAVAVALAVLAALGSRTAGALLVAGAAGYLALFVLAARRDLGVDRALLWVPAVRLLVDAAKVQGFLEGTLLRLVRRA